ncbi:MAG: glycoside hydrolase family 2 protein [Lachnospiraceae bacterium]|nr:glycoside hydrolase family 2 protein [Lachnospiraceae bacterium]
MRIYFSDDWKFTPEFTTDLLRAGFDAGSLETVRLPHTVKETPLHYFDESAYQMVSGYQKTFMVESDWKGRKKLELTLEGVAHECTVYINGVEVGTHQCGYTAVTYDITNYVTYGKKNILTLRVDSRESLNQPPFGYVIDYMTFGGVYRDVYLDVKNLVHIKEIYLHTEVYEDRKVRLYSSIRVEDSRRGVSEDASQVGYRVEQYLRKLPSGKSHQLFNKTLEKRAQMLSRGLEGISLWSPERPTLYEVTTKLFVDGELMDEDVHAVGFRSAEFRSDGFYLNHKKYKIRGLNRHQSYPYVGYAMPSSMQREDARILKEELGVNAVRTSHYPQSHAFLDACDRLGLLVVTEIPGWQHIGDAVWKNIAIQTVKEMITQYRNHTSIILWGVRINESPDDDAFYKRTNAMAHKCDPYRPTGGVRNMKKGSFLEDVYTYNDFSHDGTNAGVEPKNKVVGNPNDAYLITEYNGHMYPTKAYDSELHRTEHALRHQNVLQDVEKAGDIAGSFGWCMFDYHTHKDFGSGDHICYHGVMDAFRNPKMAAAVYRMRQNKEPFLEVSSSMDIGEHPAGQRGNVYIFTNADSVRMYKNDYFLKEYVNHGDLLKVDDYIGNAILDCGEFAPQQAEGIKTILNLVAIYGYTHFPKKVYLEAAKLISRYHMVPADAYALFQRFVGDWGGEATTYRFDAIKDGEVVASVTRGPVESIHLEVQVSHTELVEEHGYDVAAIRVLAKDQNQNILPFFQGPVQLKASGAIDLIGPSMISLQGGMGGCYVKTLKKAGKGSLKLNSEGMEAVKVDFTVTVSVD